MKRRWSPTYYAMFVASAWYVAGCAYWGDLVGVAVIGLPFVYWTLWRGERRLL